VSAVAVADPAPAQSTATVALAEPTIDAFRGVWPAVLEIVRAENQLLGALLSEARPVELRGGEVVIAFSEHEAFKRKMADGRPNRTILEEAIRSLTGSGLRVCFELRAPEEVAPGGVAAPPPSEDELVARFVAEFDAEEIIPEPDVSNEEGGS
jgi:DNA polymerase-3 subunit gamma/tau